MKNASSLVFYTITFFVIVASISISIYLLYEERTHRTTQGHEVLQEFVNTWNGLALEIQMPDDESGYQNLFPRWMKDFISSYPSIYSVHIEDTSGNIRLGWSAQTDTAHEVNYKIYDTAIRSLDDSSSWTVHMTYRVISSAVFLKIFRYLGYICIGYTLYLLASYLLQLSTIGNKTDLPNDSDTSSWQYSDPVHSDDSGHSSDSHTYSHENIDRYLSESAMLENELSLLLLFLFDQEDMPSAHSWLVKRYTDTNRVIGIDAGYYAILLPGINVHAAIQEAKTVLEYWPERGFAGISARNGRLLDGGTLLKEARAALDRARRKNEPVVGFEPDPQKYRNYIASTNSSS